MQAFVELIIAIWGVLLFAGVWTAASRLWKILKQVELIEIHLKAASIPNGDPRTIELIEALKIRKQR